MTSLPLWVYFDHWFVFIEGQWPSWTVLWCVLWWRPGRSALTPLRSSWRLSFRVVHRDGKSLTSMRIAAHLPEGFWQGQYLIAENEALRFVETGWNPYMRGILTVTKTLYIISIMSGADVAGISVTVQRFLKQLLASGDRWNKPPPNMGWRHYHYECILTIDSFSLKANDLPEP